MRLLHLCSGEDGVSPAFRDRGWEVVTLDIEPCFHPDIVADVRDFHWDGDWFDMVWAGPPCTEFARQFMPWCRVPGVIPDLSIMRGCKRVIKEIKPRFWVIENVKGAIEWFYPELGNYRYGVNPYFLWGWFPVPGRIKVVSNKEKLSSSQAIKRAVIPYKLAETICKAVEFQPVLL